MTDTHKADKRGARVVAHARVGTRRGRLALTLAAATAAAAFAALSAWPPIDRVETGRTPEYPDVQPQSFRFSQLRVVAAVVESIDSLDRFELSDSDEAEGLVQAVARWPLGSRVDDIEVRVEANGEGGALVFIVSASRAVRGDFGQNARNIRELQRAIAQNLGVDQSEGGSE